MRSNDSTLPDPVPLGDRPEQTVETIPDEIVTKALETATVYRACPECDSRQWMIQVPGHNSTHECNDCGETLTVVG